MKELAKALAVGIVCAGCGDLPDQVEISETREADPHRPPPASMTAAERFGFSPQLPPGHPPIENGQFPGETANLSQTSDFTWNVPDGWMQGPSRPMRVVTFLAGQDQAVECYVSELGGGLGIEANLNRWCGQMGNPLLEEGAVEHLPHIEVLGRSAPFLELRGDYHGMRGGPRKNSFLLGTMAVSGEQTLFIKMIGPEAQADDQRQAFVAFCESLQLSPSQLEL